MADPLDTDTGHPTYHGSCHCGAVQFQITATIDELTTCDCSLCVKKNALMSKVHEDQFKLLSGQSVLKTYQWNMQIAQHSFCSQCGIYTFHRKRAQPDHYGINIYCLDDFDARTVSVRATEGQSMSVAAQGARKVWPGPRVP